MALVLQDAFEVMLLPRRVMRRVRLSGTYFRLAWAAWKGLARVLPPGPTREAWLSHFGALSMLGLFVLWAGLLICCFGAAFWSLQETRHSPLAEQIYMSGVTFFTVGYGDVAPTRASTRLLAVVEAGTGLGFLAVVIGYLPVLYQLFSRREAHVIQLDARAGSPPTAATMLCRHAEAGGLDKLDELLRDWEVWGAELLESHLSYPMLAFYRSQHHNQSWLTAIAAVMDCCALILVGVKELPPLQARMTFGMTRQVLVEMARSFRVEPSRYEGGDRLPPEVFAALIETLTPSGLVWHGGADAEVALLTLRATYEPLLDGLARYLMLPLPGWLPEPGATDHLQQGHRGLLASRMVEQLVGRTGERMHASETGTTIWRRVRQRLRE